jgi:hypothetical protein
LKSQFSVLLLLFIAKLSFGQTYGLGSWNIINLKYTVSQKVSLFGEAQIRSLKFYDNFHYYEYKGGINFKFDKNAVISLGAGSYQTFNEGGNFVLPKNNAEFRIWPQLIFNQKVWKFNIEQRYRSEFRLTSNGYRNRFRYRLGVSYQFDKQIEDYKPYQISASNELFFTNKQPYFERNRLLLAFNFKPSKLTNIQAGYLHQFDYRINDETGRDFFVIGYSVELLNKKLNK